jgi:aspartyl aminopeptidase
MKMNNTNKLLDFIKIATSPYHVVKESVRRLELAGFKELNFSTPWSLENGESYFTVPYGTTLFAFTLGDSLPSLPDFRIAAAHTDHPGFQIKPKAEISQQNYLRLNTQAYGGAILHTWLDRPLSIAGRVMLKSENIFKPQSKLIDFKTPLLTIPSLAIHVNPDVNKGIELNKQKDMLPLFTIINNSLNKDHYFINFLAAELKADPADILDFDLYIYNMEQGCSLGMNQDFISSPRLDNLTSVLALLEGIIHSHRSNGINLIALYDNEEIGSRSKQGADSMLSNILLEKIFSSLGKTRTQLYDSIMKSFLISVDVAHGLHPNYPEKSDPTTIAQLGNGVVIKIDSTQKYASDTEAIAIIQQLCNSNNIKYQKFVNRSDMSSGSTLGSIASSWLPMKTVDLGIPLLAMHAARETMGSLDQVELESLVKSLFKTN